MKSPTYRMTFKSLIAHTHTNIPVVTCSKGLEQPSFLLCTSVLTGFVKVSWDNLIAVVVLVLWDKELFMWWALYPSLLQNMSTFESELENLLGEFHIKMKGERKILWGKSLAADKLISLHADIYFWNRKKSFSNVHRNSLVMSWQLIHILYSQHNLPIEHVYTLFSRSPLN